MLVDTQAVVLRIFYRFSCPDRDTIRQCFYRNGVKPLKLGVERAIELHLKECPNCAYETLPPPKL